MRHEGFIVSKVHRELESGTQILIISNLGPEQKQEAERNCKELLKKKKRKKRRNSNHLSSMTDVVAVDQTGKDYFFAFSNQTAKSLNSL